MRTLNLTARLNCGLALGACLSIAPAASAGPCPPDIDCSGTVGVSDLLSVISNWGNPGATDLDNSGSTGVADLLQVISTWGPCVLDFGPGFANEEAAQIGLETLGPGGPLTLPQATYDRVVRDLDLIRAAYPTLASETHTPAWLPNQIIANVNNTQGMDYLCANTYYQVIDIDPLFSTWYVLTFAGPVNVPAMAEAYGALASVDFAEPNGLIGGQNFYVPTAMPNGTWRWEIDDGFLDCFDGCDCHRVFTIDVTARGEVSLVACEQFGQTWCEFDGSPCP